jgi:hypothetical protein
MPTGRIGYFVKQGCGNDILNCSYPHGTLREIGINNGNFAQFILLKGQSISAKHRISSRHQFKQVSGPILTTVSVLDITSHTRLMLCPCRQLATGPGVWMQRLDTCGGVAFTSVHMKYFDDKPIAGLGELMARIEGRNPRGFRYLNENILLFKAAKKPENGNRSDFDLDDLAGR